MPGYAATYLTASSPLIIEPGRRAPFPVVVLAAAGVTALLRLAGVP